MHNSNKSAYLNLFQILTDVFAVIGTFIFSYLFTRKFTCLYHLIDYTWILCVFLPFWLLIMKSQEMYNDTCFNYFDRIFICILKATFISGAFVVAIIYMIKLTIYSRIFLMTFLVFSIFFLFLKRSLFSKFKIKYNIFKPKRVILIGTPELYDKFLYYIEKTDIKFNIINFINISNGTSVDNNIKLLEPVDLENAIKKFYIDEIIFILPKKYIFEAEKYITLCEKMGITNRLLLDLYNLKISKTHIGCLGTLPMITFHTINLNRLQLLLKRSLDIIGAAIGIVITFIIGIFIIILIKLESNGPIIFSQKRVGLNGRIFDCYKFRSMCVDAEEKQKSLMLENELKTNFMFKMKNDPRTTKVGKFLRKTSLDELPQFFNVIKGNMSLVGTRPPTLNEVKEYDPYHRRRISINPGITGMWQVNGRNSIKNFDKVVKLDTEYIDNWSNLLDIKILLKTIFVVLRCKSS